MFHHPLSSGEFLTLGAWLPAAWLGMEVSSWLVGISRVLFVGEGHQEGAVWKAA